MTLKLNRLILGLLLGSAAQFSYASSEANLVLPNLNDVALASFVGGVSGWQLLAWGLLALATAFDHIPSFRAAALILYAVDWLALAIAATVGPAPRAAR